MPKLPEPDDVDFFVGGGDPDPAAVAATLKAIEESKRRPGFEQESREADAIFAQLRIEPQRYGMADAQGLLDHWRRCLADLDGNGRDPLDEFHREQASERLGQDQRSRVF